MTGRGIFDRVAALEAAFGAVESDLAARGADLAARVARCEAVIAAQAELIDLFLTRMPADSETQAALEAVRLVGAGPVLPLPELRAILRVVVPVLQARGVTLDDLRGERRLQHLVEARWAVARALQAEGYSRERIARFLQRDVSTVAHGLRQGVRA